MNANNLRQQARTKHLQGDTQSAIILLTQAIAENPQDILIALDMVQIFLDIDELQQAKSLFDRLPKQALETEMGVAIISQLNFKNLALKTAGKKILQEQITQSVDNYQARFDLAICLFAEHNIEQGMELLFFIQKNNSTFNNGVAKEMIITICNMLDKNNHKTSSIYRQKLAQLIN